ncbi:hypothetical protein KJZ99_07425 [bacterium]|nr:hypothetical protein [bacterium]
MKKFVIGLLALMFVLASSASATIRYVSASGAGAFTTISAAASAAVSGDTILIGPGNYSDGNINVFNKRLTYIGAGWDQTIIALSAVWYANTSGQNGTSWEGMQVNGSGQMFLMANSADSISFRRCIIGGTSVGSRLIDGQAGRSLTVEDCILLGNLTTTGAPMIDITTANYPTTFRNCVFVNRGGHTSCRAIGGAATSGTVEVYNSVFLNFSTVLALSAAGGPVIAVNNIFYDWLASPSFGSYNTGASVWDYNSSTASPAAPGSNTTVITSNPFANYNTANNYEFGITDLRLDPVNGVSLINSGHPSLLDFLDGSQSDRGVYGGPKPLVDNGMPNYPWAVNIVLNPNLVGVGTPVNATAVGRVGPQY